MDRERLVRLTTTLYANRCVTTGGACTSGATGSPDCDRIGSVEGTPSDNVGGGLGNWHDMNYCCNGNHGSGKTCTGQAFRTASEAQAGWAPCYGGGKGHFGTDTFAAAANTCGGRVVLLARIVLAGVSASMLAARALTTPRNAADPHPLPLLAGPLGAIGVALWVVLRGPDKLGEEAVMLAGAITTVAAVSAWLLEAARRGVESERAWIEAAMMVPGRRLTAQGTVEEGALDLRAGERLLVEEGEDVPVDMIVSEGDAEVLPWLGAVTPVRRRAGDPVVAGARVHKGRLVGTSTWAGWTRIT